MKLIIGGDFCITQNYLSKNLLDDSIKAIFDSSDYNLVNLECPITPDEPDNKILKTGPHLRSDERILNHLKSLKINAVTLANNHLLDYGQQGLNDTLHTLQSHKISCVGAGNNIAEASKPLIVKMQNLKIAIVNFCENEWSIATNKNGGANPLDIVDNTNQIKEAKKIADFVIVIAHGGHEYYQLPNPRMVKQYRFFVDNGADAVVGHHTHCFSGYEIYNNCPIAYSLGNMVFTKDSKHKVWYNGLLAQLKIEKNKPIDISLHPIKQQSGNFKLDLLRDNEENEIQQQIKHLNTIIQSNDKLQQEWDKYIEQRNNAVEIFSPINFLPGKYIRAALKKIGLNKTLLKKTNLKNQLNHIRCEAHRDVLIGTLIKKLK
ncbi:MAG: CapA family protein [bacterium]